MGTGNVEELAARKKCRHGMSWLAIVGELPGTILKVSGGQTSLPTDGYRDQFSEAISGKLADFRVCAQEMVWNRDGFGEILLLETVQLCGKVVKNWVARSGSCEGCSWLVRGCGEVAGCGVLSCRICCGGVLLGVVLQAGGV